MDLPVPLIPGRLVRRYKRFLADVALQDGSTVTAHCPNSGSMMGLGTPGLRVWLSRSGNPKRKLAHTLELVEAEGTLVGIHTGRPNRLAEDAIRNGTIAPLAGYATLRREVRYDVNSRVDLLLGGPDRPDCYVEVKNVHLRRPHGPHPTAAEFPDCVTARGAKHLGALIGVRSAGMRAVLLYIVQRADCDHFRLAVDLDPLYAAGAVAAAAAGVEFLCYGCDVQPSGIAVSRRLSMVV
ncbi:MAG: DNA/RNA nuclease SfsA [Rhodospirillaceae bacterium]|nr:DNA/RNA nuclease SfsA [Rhodospirillaceae bacterium]